MKIIHLVVDYKNAPGRVYAIFESQNDALLFRDAYHEDNADVEARTLVENKGIIDFRQINNGFFE